MKKREIVEKTIKFAKSKLYGESTGHDWWHTLRVWQMAKKIGRKEKANLLIVELAALLHDIADWKFQKNKDDSASATIAGEWLKELGLDSKTISQIGKIIRGITFKGAKVKDSPLSLEGKVVQDADRLDALGAIGIARCFAYGGSKKRQIYDPNIRPKLHRSFKEYKENKSPSINHFYEKLLLLKKRMKTKTGRLIAEQRDKFMREYLKEFFEEWRGKK